MAAFLISVVVAKVVAKAVLLGLGSSSGGLGGTGWWFSVVGVPRTGGRSSVVVAVGGTAGRDVATMCLDTCTAERGFFGEGLRVAAGRVWKRPCLPVFLAFVAKKSRTGASLW